MCTYTHTSASMNTCRCSCRGQTWDRISHWAQSRMTAGKPWGPFSSCTLHSAEVTGFHLKPHPAFQISARVLNPGPEASWKHSYPQGHLPSLYSPHFLEEECDFWGPEKTSATKSRSWETGWGTNLCVGFVLQTKREDLRSSVLKPFVFSSFSFLLSFSFQWVSFTFLFLHFIHFAATSPFSSFIILCTQCTLSSSFAILLIPPLPLPCASSYSSILTCLNLLYCNFKISINSCFVNIHPPYATKTLSFWVHRWFLSVHRPSNNLWKEKACVFPGHRMCHTYQRDNADCVSCVTVSSANVYTLMPGMNW